MFRAHLLDYFRSGYGPSLSPLARDWTEKTQTEDTWFPLQTPR